MRLHFGRPTEASSFAELLEQMPDTEFASVTRSTVTLLDWWNDADCVRAVGDVLGLGDLRGGDARFEYPVSPRCHLCRGRGKASFTDLLLELCGNVVAVEAKHREKLYETVGKWLDTPASENRRRVLQHWVACCIRSWASESQCMRLVYQMVHRTASACHVAAQRGARAHVVYLLFESKHMDAYVEAVGALADVLSVAERVRFAVVNVPTTEAIAFDEIAFEHQRLGPDGLRDALATGKRLFEFGKPQLVFTHPRFTEGDEP